LKQRCGLVGDSPGGVSQRGRVRTVAQQLT
jgi:hypothetical protein